MAAQVLNYLGITQPCEVSVWLVRSCLFHALLLPYSLKIDSCTDIKIFNVCWYCTKLFECLPRELQELEPTKLCAALSFFATVKITPKPGVVGHTDQFLLYFPLIKNAFLPLSNEVWTNSVSRQVTRTNLGTFSSQKAKQGSASFFSESLNWEFARWWSSNCVNLHVYLHGQPSADGKADSEPPSYKLPSLALLAILCTCFFYHIRNRFTVLVDCTYKSRILPTYVVSLHALRHLLSYKIG